MQQKDVSKGLLTIFALPAIIQSFMHVPASTALQGVYATDFNVSVTALGVALVLAKLFDAVSDPLIGILSDKYFAKHHTRKPFLIIGTLITAPSIWFLYTPPDDPSVYWFAGWFIATYFGWTITEVPYRAWSLSLSNNYERRSFIQMLLTLFGFTGAAFFFLLPAISKANGWADSTEVTGQTLALAAMVIVVAMPLLNLLIIGVVPNGPVHATKKEDSAADVLRSLTQNKPFLYMIALYVIVGIGAGMNQALSFFFIGNYLQIPEKYATIMVIALPFSLLGAPASMLMCNLFQKHVAWAITLVIMIFPNLYMLLMVEPGEAAFWPMVVCISIALFGYAGGIVAVASMLGDVVDYGILNFGQDRSGTYSSVYTFATKVVGALGNGIALILIGFFGFEATAAVVSDSAGFGLKLSYLVIPVIGMAAAIPFILKYPITRQKHAEILAGIEERDRQAGLIPASE